MKKSRRKFIKNGLLAGLGTLLIPPFFRETKADPKIKQGLLKSTYPKNLSALLNDQSRQLLVHYLSTFGDREGNSDLV